MNTAKDTRTQAMEVCEVEHRYLHADRHYFGCSYLTGISTTVGRKWILKTPNDTNYWHLTWEFNSGLNGEIFFNEAVTASGGTTLTTYNSCRDEAAGSLGFTEHATVTANGTELYHQIIGSDGGPSQKTGGEIQRDHEWILKPNTSYALRYYPVTANDRASFKFYAYKE